MRRNIQQRFWSFVDKLMTDLGFRKARNEAEARLAEFVLNAEANASFVYTTSAKPQSFSLMSLARSCYEEGLVVLVQKRVGTEIYYVAIKRETSGAEIKEKRRHVNRT